LVHIDLEKSFSVPRLTSLPDYGIILSFINSRKHCQQQLRPVFGASQRFVTKRFLLIFTIIPFVLLIANNNKKKLFHSLFEQPQSFNYLN